MIESIKNALVLVVPVLMIFGCAKEPCDYRVKYAGTWRAHNGTSFNQAPFSSSLVFEQVPMPGITYLPYEYVLNADGTGTYTALGQGQLQTELDLFWHFDESSQNFVFNTENYSGSWSVVGYKLLCEAKDTLAMSMTRYGRNANGDVTVYIQSDLLFKKL